ncbi:MAG: DUF3999 family protein [Pseudomonadota bacterium]
MPECPAPLALLAAVALVPGAAAAEALSPNEFASGFAITADAQADIYAVELQLEVYGQLTDPGLRDLAVFDGAARPVPRIVRRPVPTEAVTEQRMPLPAFPLYADRVPSPERLHLLLESADDGTRLVLNPRAEVSNGPGISGLVLDATAIEGALTAIEFEHSAETAGNSFLGSIAVSASDDLRNWRPVGEAALAALGGAGADAPSLRQARVEIGRSVADYYLVRWRDVPAGWYALGATGLRAETIVTTNRRWQTLQAEPGGSRDDGYVFGTGGPLAVDRVLVRTDTANTLLRVAIDAKAAADAAWRQVTEASFFSGDDTGTAAVIGSRRDRWWRVRVLQGRVEAPPRLALGWQPDELLFVAQESGPYTLAAGRAREAVEQFPTEAEYGDRGILALLADDGSAASAAAVLGPRYNLGGPAMLTVPPDRSAAILKLTLWLVLIAGVATVGVMAVRLLRGADS